MKDQLATPHPADAKSVWLVIAAYNEGARIGDTLRKVCAYPYNAVVVDDGSRDDTAEAALRFPVWVLQHSINLGQGAALATGIKFAIKQGAKFIVTFDADGQHQIEEVERLVDPVRDGKFDMALGSRFLGSTVGMPASRAVVLKLGVLFTRVVSRIKVTDTHNGFRCFSRSAAQAIEIHQNRMAHASEILDEIQRMGLRYCEVPVTIRYSEQTLAKGQSSWNAFKIVGQFLLGRILK